MVRPSVAAFGPGAPCRLRSLSTLLWSAGRRRLAHLPVSRQRASQAVLHVAYAFRLQLCCMSLTRVICSHASLSQRCPGVSRTARCSPLPVRNYRADGLRDTPEKCTTGVDRCCPLVEHLWHGG